MYQVKSYDIEIFPNYALFVFIDIEPYMEMYRRIHDPKTKKLLVSESEKIRLIKEIPHVCFEISSIEGYEKNDILALLDYCNQWDYLVGFNILDYDNIVLNMLAMDLYKFESIKDINTRLFKLSSKIVNTDRDLLKNDAVHKLYKYYGARYYSIDLQKIPALDKIFKGLKQTLINLKWFKIEEHSLPDLTVDELKYYDLPPLLTLQQSSKYINHWHRFLTKDHVQSVIDYCINDVKGCCELFCFLEEQISLRFNLKAQYDIDVLSASDSKIADIFIAKYYSEYTGIPYKEYKDLRTHRTRMNIGKVISPLVKFKSKEFNDLLVSLMSKTVSSTNEINYPVTFNGVTYDIKSGGLHSRDNPKIYVFPDGSCYIEDGDVGSYYPTLTKNMKVAPKHLDQEAFIEVTVIMMNERLEAKSAGDTVKANSLKITINVGMFGKFNFAYSFLFDTLCTLTVTINGQLMLLMLIERLALNGIQNVSANTDGIVCIIPKDKYDLYHQICDEWAKEVNFIFEYTPYVKYARLDVNNYITVKKKKDGTLDVKRKGGLNQYLSTEDLKKGFNKPVIAKAVEEYIVHDVPIRDTILNETDIYMFCATQNMDDSFDPVYRRVVNGLFVEEKLQKTIRYYISESGGVLLKKKGNKYTNVIKGQNVVIFNDYFEAESMKAYNIKYSYYIKEAQKIIDIIQSGIKGNKKKDIDKRSNQYVGDLFSQPGIAFSGFPDSEEGSIAIADASELIDVAEYLDTVEEDTEYIYHKTARKGEFDEVKFNAMYMDDKPFVTDNDVNNNPYAYDTSDDLPF